MSEAISGGELGFTIQVGQAGASIQGSSKNAVHTKRNTNAGLGLARNHYLEAHSRLVDAIGLGDAFVY